MHLAFVCVCGFCRLITEGERKDIQPKIAPVQRPNPSKASSWLRPSAQQTEQVFLRDCWTDIFTGQMPFLTPIQQCQSSEANTAINLDMISIIGKKLAYA